MSNVRLTPERLAEIDQGLKEYVENGLGAYDPVLYARELRDAYDAVAREVEAYKAQLEAWRKQPIMHGGITIEEVKSRLLDTERQLAEAEQRIELLEKESHTLANEILRWKHAAEQAEARLAVDDQIIEQIADALDGLPIAGDKVHPAGRKYLNMADQIKALRERLAAVSAALEKAVDYSRRNLGGEAYLTYLLEDLSALATARP